MIRLFKTLLITVLILLPFSMTLADVPVEGKARYSTSADSNKGDIYRNYIGANIVFLKPYDQTTVNINLQGEYDTSQGSDSVPPVSPNGSSMSSRSRVYFREASITQDFYFKNVGLDSFTLKGGILSEKWGYTDFYNPVNIINPQDYSYHLMNEYRDRVLGVYAIKTTLYFSQYFFIDGLINPLFEPDNESSATFTNSNMKSVQSYTALGGTYNGTGYPDESLSSSSYAARVGVKTRDFETHVMYYDGYDHSSLPRYTLNGTVVDTQREYERLRMVGADFMANFAWDINMKGEVAYFISGKEFRMKDSDLTTAINAGESGYEKSSLLDYTAGFEVVKNLKASAFIFNLEFNENIIIDHKSSLDDKKITNRILGEMQYSFVKKTVILKSAGHYCVEDSDLGAQFELGLKPESMYTIKIGYWLFQPFSSAGKTGLFGAYDKQDFVYLSGDVAF